MCCGMGGSYSLKLPEISAPILERKLETLRRPGADRAHGLSRLRDADSRRNGQARLQGQGRAHGYAAGRVPGVVRRIGCEGDGAATSVRTTF